jgi:DNA polymerase-3 subunit epsilon
MSILDNFHDKRDSADEDICGFLSGAKNYNIIILDTETNGFVGNPMPSLLSISAERGELFGDKEFRAIDSYNRFYYPRENYNPRAIKTNGLIESKITENRKDSEPYAVHFDEDYVSFIQFCEGVDLFIGHNLFDFDTKFVPCIDWKTKKIFDTMKSNRDIICGEWQGYRNQWKNPRLVEAVEFYKIDVDASQLHGSKYDVAMTLAVFMEMLQRADIRLKKF